MIAMILKFGAPYWIRTSDPQLRRLLLYPTELRAQLKGQRRVAHHAETVRRAGWNRQSSRAFVPAQRLEELPMRTILAACIALSAIGAIAASPARADDPYWRQHSDWQARATFHGDQYQKDAWAHEHCVRDWQGQEFCRR
jgi:hypothetical protein